MVCGGLQRHRSGLSLREVLACVAIEPLFDDDRGNPGALGQPPREMVRHSSLFIPFTLSIPAQPYAEQLAAEAAALEQQLEGYWTELQAALQAAGLVAE